MRFSDESPRNALRATAASRPEGTTAVWLMDMAELWADAMERYLDSGTPIATAAPAAFNQVMPQTGDPIGIFSHEHDFIVDYLEDCRWVYAEALRVWYDANRPTPH